ncbi:hypothetical protein Theos_0988 [Thermus oshimai JL-2]|uniref:Uncharacterized protein n=1 Tax=Thermus oshimai JL-2 TaxID=751945 RepID=K7QUN2_THEOS|nr:hypothetical protein [Thermus oshimai]AFV76041.1 hypothetical protein Theos_0988 [Thermus oshimai JL-2]
MRFWTALLLLPLLLGGPPAWGREGGEGGLPPLTAEPGATLLLTFQDAPPGGRLAVPEGLAVLLPPKGQGGVEVAVLKVPSAFPPGSYAVCLEGEGARVCRTILVPARPRLDLAPPARALGQELRLLLKNGGNVPLGIRLSALEGEVESEGKILSLPPGAEEEVRLALRGYGLLRLSVSAPPLPERIHLIRVLPEGGAPPPYVLLGHLALRSDEGGTLSLEGPLARDAGLALRLAYPLEGSAIGLSHGPYALRLSPSALEGGYAAGGVGIRLGVGRGSFWTEGVWRESGGQILYALRLSGQGVEGAYADGTYALRLGWAGSVYAEAHRYGDPYLFGRYASGSLSLALSTGGLDLEGQYPFGLRLAYRFAEPSFFGRLEGRFWEGGWTFSARVAYPLSPLAVGLSGEVGTFPRLGLSLAYGGRPLSGNAEVGWSPPDLSASLALSYEEEPLAFRLLVGYPYRFFLEGIYRFRLPVPQELTLALGGYDRVPVEGVVRLGDKGLGGVRLGYGDAEVRTDMGGRFLLYLPREGARVRVEPPPGILALPREVFLKPGEGPVQVDLPPAARLSLTCQGEGGRGALLVGPVSLLLGCGGRAILPPGVYRVLPQALPGYEAEPGEVALSPEEEKGLTLTFTRPLLPEGERGPFSVRVPSAVAPGEAFTLEVNPPGPFRAFFAGKAYEGEGPLLLQTPWEARPGEALPLRVETELGRKTLLLRVEAKPLLQVSLVPSRARLGEVVEVVAETLFPAEEVSLLLPGGTLPLERKGPGLFAGRFSVDERFYEGAEKVTETLLGLSLKVRACQGERCVEEGKRLLLR